ncbi:hypothetical protein D3C84_645770 [compost metagenome]
MIGADLVEQADATPFLTDIQQDAATGLGDLLHGGLQLEAAVAAQAEQGVPGQTLGMNSAQHGLTVRDIAHHQRGVILACAGFLKAYQREDTPRGRQLGFGYESNAAHRVAPDYSCLKKAASLTCLTPNNHKNKSLYSGMIHSIGHNRRNRDDFCAIVRLDNCQCRCIRV